MYSTDDYPTNADNNANAKAMQQNESLLCVRNDLSVDIIRNLLDERQGYLLDHLCL
jgi:hypothetical protein